MKETGFADPWFRGSAAEVVSRGSLIALLSYVLLAASGAAAPEHCP